MMYDNFSTSAWADLSPKFYADVSDALAKFHFAFERLAEIEFAAPWDDTKPVEHSRLPTV